MSWEVCAGLVLLFGYPVWMLLWECGLKRTKPAKRYVAWRAKPRRSMGEWD